MSEPYKKTQLAKFPRTTETSAEARYWSEYKIVHVHKYVAKITDIFFCPTMPHDFAVTASTRAHILDQATCTTKKTVTRFSDVAYSASFRTDGKLMIAGNENGSVQIFDLSSRSVLRNYRHDAPVHVTKFSASNLHVLSASDDKTMRRVDVTTTVELCVMDHKDYIRCALESPVSEHTWISGSYDHTVKLWDVRVPVNGTTSARAGQRGPSCASVMTLDQGVPVNGTTSARAGQRGPSCASVMTLDQGVPVEALFAMPTGGLLFAAGNNEIKAWDLVSGGRMLHSFSNHQKTITSLALDSSQSRLLSGSLDHSVKIYDLSTYKVSHSLKYAAPVLTVAMSPTNETLAVGLLDGTLSVRRRVKKADVVEAEAKQQKIARTGTRAYLLRGQSVAPGADDFKMEHVKKQRLAPYDALLKRFQYHDALDAALETKRAVVVSSVLDELIQRSSLRLALSSRDDRTLQPLLKFLVKSLTNPRYSTLLIDVTNIVLDMYTRVLGQSMMIDELFVELKKAIDQETQLHRQLLAVQGSVSLLIATSENVQRQAALTAEAPAIDDSLLLATTSSSSAASSGMDESSDESDGDDSDEKETKESKRSSSSTTPAVPAAVVAPVAAVTNGVSKKSKKGSTKPAVTTVSSSTNTTNIPATPAKTQKATAATTAAATPTPAAATNGKRKAVVTPSAPTPATTTASSSTKGKESKRKRVDA